MNALLALTAVAVLGCFLQGANSQSGEPESAPEVEPMMEVVPALSLDEQVQDLKRNLTALWKVVRLLQAQVIIRSHDTNAHAITNPDHLDAEKTNPGGAGRSVHVHMHEGHMHLHEIIDGNPANADTYDDDVAHSHTKHAHRHGDHYHFHEDITGNHHPQLTGSGSIDNVNEDIVGIVDEATN
ncbi:uncharacterized protein LOC135490864 [Lineus longissimus]|uniref:uncharacterized protein LOC135490864 n=1 Tax=Lineus longissimus TaxID=88925 RepID=UPI002B4F6378